jgi:ElaB/YqjD/DUF883 family membrane-anchored ribosome-binding protein
MDPQGDTNRVRSNVTSSGGTGGEVAEGLHNTADTARELAQTLERGANALDSASRTADRVSQKVERVSSAVSSARASVMEHARAHPMLAVATAVTAGFLLGRRGD